MSRNSNTIAHLEKRIAELERKLSQDKLVLDAVLDDSAKKSEQLAERDAQLKIVVEQLNDFASARWVDNVRYQAKQALRKIGVGDV